MQKFLLHTCCAPCSIAIIDELCRGEGPARGGQAFALTVFFYNPNIFPLEEYIKRKNEVIKVCTEWQVPMIDMDYEVEEWNNTVAKGLEGEPEGGARCPLCFKFRLAKAAEYAAKNSFDYFSTSLTSGRNKKADIINLIGEFLAKQFGVKFYAEDWKKGGREEKGRKMIKERGIYRQNYCGCKYSLKLT